jgi:hypothetical protein
MSGVLENVTKDPLKLGLGLVLVVGAVYYFGKRAVTDAAAGVAKVATVATDVALDVVDGNNVVTQGARTSAYQGAGVAGTVGAAVDRVSGGVFSRIGEWIGGKAADATEYFAAPSGDKAPTSSTTRVQPSRLAQPGSLSGQGFF